MMSNGVLKLSFTHPLIFIHSVSKQVVVQLLSRVQLFETPWTAACQASLYFSISWSLLKLMSIELMMPTG